MSKSTVTVRSTGKRRGSMAFEPILPLILSGFAILLLSGCQKSPKSEASTQTDSSKQSLEFTGSDLKYFYPDAPRSGNGNSYAHVKYASNVHQLEKAQGLDGLIAESTDGRVLVFKASTPGITSLKADDILLIKGVTARKILLAEQKGDEEYLAVDVASIREIVADGEIRLEAPVRFGNVKTGILGKPQAIPFTPASLFDLFATPAYAQGMGPENNAAATASNNAATGATIDGFGNMMKGLGKFAIGDWKVVQYSAIPVDGRLNLDLEMAKDVSGFKALIDVHGFLSNFDLLQNMQLGSYFASTQLMAAFKTLGGQLRLQWRIGKETPGGYAKEDRFKLPVSVSIPLAQYVAGFPLVLEISAAMIIHPALTGGSEIAAGAYTVTYNGDMMGNAVQSGTAASGDFQGAATLDQDAGASAVAPVGMVIAYCFPRFELSVGLSKIFPALGQKGAAGTALNKAVAQADTWLNAVTGKLPPVNGGPSGTGLIASSLTSNAAIFAQLLSTAGVTRSGAGALAPCSNVDLHVTGQVGVNANMFGAKVDENKHTSDVFTKAFSRNTGGACAGIGK